MITMAYQRRVSDGAKRTCMGLYIAHIPTTISILLHIYNQEISACDVVCNPGLVPTTVTRTIEKIMAITVREKILNKPSFCFQGMCTFQSIRIGIVITVRFSVRIVLVRWIWTH